MATQPDIQVIPAWTLGRRDREVRDGWDVLIDEEWHDRLPTKRDALAMKARLEDRFAAHAEQVQA